jgi:hypothetical protein
MPHEEQRALRPWAVREGARKRQQGHRARAVIVSAVPDPAVDRAILHASWRAQADGTVRPVDDLSFSVAEMVVMRPESYGDRTSDGAILASMHTTRLPSSRERVSGRARAEVISERLARSDLRLHSVVDRRSISFNERAAYLDGQ